jgi:hypothetical protein
VIHFDASNSSDADALDGNGIETYEWKVLFDAPYGDDTFNLDGHTFIQTAASQGDWSYRFRNVTVDPTGTTENQIRIELVVYDSAGKFSEKHRMYFVVVPDGFGDAEPIVQLNTNGLNDSKVDTDTITISGTVLSGAESEKDVFVEVAFTEDAFTSTPKQQFNLTQRGLWVKSPALGDSDSFELTLNLDEMYTNKSRDLRIFIKIFEGDTLNQ